MTKDKGTVDFTGDPDAVAAVARAKAARVPVGGVAMPNMPRLDQPPPNPSSGVQSVRAAQRVLTPDEQQRLAEQGRYHPGVGSAYAVNQPGVAAQPTDSEGNEQPIDPRLAPRPPGSGLRQETVKGLEAISAHNTSDDDTELRKIDKEIAAFDDVYEEDEFGRRVVSLLGNVKRKEIIEARCPPLSFEELLMTGSVQQRVPIIPGKFEPTFRSLLGEENEEILRMMNSFRGPDQYILDVMSLLNLTAGLYAINGKPLPNHQDKNGDFEEEMFRAKYKVVRKMALPLLADMSVNFRWFIRRVQKLTVVDDIKSF
jgi:hypothetical protein